MDPGFGETEPGDLRYNYIMYIKNRADLLKRRRRQGKHIRCAKCWNFCARSVRVVWGYICPSENKLSALSVRSFLVPFFGKKILSNSNSKNVD